MRDRACTPRVSTSASPLFVLECKEKINLICQKRNKKRIHDTHTHAPQPILTSWSHPFLALFSLTNGHWTCSLWESRLISLFLFHSLYISLSCSCAPSTSHCVTPLPRAGEGSELEAGSPAANPFLFHESKDVSPNSLGLTRWSSRKSRASTMLRPPTVR